MQTNLFYSRFDFHSLHNTTEGTLNRSLRLILLTNKESAYKVIDKNIFTNDLKEFGRGLYFVETLEESEKFDIKDKAVVLCQVFVGVSLILTKKTQNISEKYLKSKNCDSVKGYLSASQKYYIVYNYKKVKKILTLKAEKSVVRDFEVSVKCVNHLCKYHGTIHKVECQLFCKQKNCRFYNSYHKLPCEQKCQVINCELFDFFHESECKLRCTWENCLMFGNYHEKKCIHLDHEKSFEANEEGIIYNKVNYKEKTEKTEKIRMKKKSTKVNPKKVNKEQFKWNIPQNTYRNELYSRSYEFPLLGNSETQYFNRPDPTVYTSKPEAKIRYTDYYAPRPNYNFNEYQSSYNLPNITKTNKIVANEFYKSDSRGYLKLDEKYTLHRESNLDSNRKVSENNYFFPSTKCYCIFLGFCISCILIYLIA